MKKLISAAWTGRSIRWDTLSRALVLYTPKVRQGGLLVGEPLSNIKGFVVFCMLPELLEVQIFLFRW
jgi:hypothetical protein